MLEILKPYITQFIQWGSIVLGAIFILFKAKQSGTIAEQRKEAMQTLKGVQERTKIENNLNNLSDAALDKLYNEQIKR